MGKYVTDHTFCGAQTHMVGQLRGHHHVAEQSNDSSMRRSKNRVSADYRQTATKESDGSITLIHLAANPQDCEIVRRAGLQLEK